MGGTQGCPESPEKGKQRPIIECGREQIAKDLGEEAQKDVTKIQQGWGRRDPHDTGKEAERSPTRCPFLQRTE